MALRLFMILVYSCHHHVLLTYTCKYAFLCLNMLHATTVSHLALFCVTSKNTALDLCEAQEQATVSPFGPAE